MKNYNVTRYIVAAVIGLTGVQTCLAESASEQLEMVGKCLAINTLYKQNYGAIPAANAAYMKKWDKARIGTMSAYNVRIKPCTDSGRTVDSCINTEVGTGYQALLKGFSYGITAFNQAHRVNDKATISVFMMACTA